MTDTLPETQNILQDNLSALEKYYPHIYSAIKVSLSSCSISFSGPDNRSITITDNQKQITISAHQREEALSIIIKAEIDEPIYLIIGLGAGDELQKLFSITQFPIPELASYKLPIYIIEPEPLMLIASMWLYDMCGLLESQRVQWFIGEDAPSEFVGYFESHRQAIHPTHFISHWYPDDHPAVCASRQNINEMLNKTNVAIYQLKIKINKHYNKITLDEWRDIFTASKRPLRVMGWTSRFTSFLQYCMRDLLAGFNELGHETLMHIEESDICRTTQHDILARIDKFQPDLILIIDHFRGEYPYLPINIPFVNWIQDLLPNIINPGSRTFQTFDFTYVFAPRWLDMLASIPAYANHKIDVLHLGINPKTYYPLKDTEKTFDVLYVSHLVSIEKTLRPLAMTAANFRANPDEIKLINSGLISNEQLLIIYSLIINIFDGLLIDELWKYAHTPTRKPFILSILNEADIPTEESVIEHFLTSKRILNDIVFAIKTRPLATLIKQGLDVRIYGNNWDLLADFHDHAHGPITNGPPLNLLMNQARVCLNNSQGVSLHMRALEILGSGSFMLSRDISPDNSDIREFFRMNEEVFFFKNEVDIAEKVNYWMEHKPEREQLSNLTHTKALSIFDYKNIARTIHTSIQERLSSIDNP